MNAAVSVNHILKTADSGRTIQGNPEHFDRVPLMLLFRTKESGEENTPSQTSGVLDKTVSLVTGAET